MFCSKKEAKIIKIKQNLAYRVPTLSLMLINEQKFYEIQIIALRRLVIKKSQKIMFFPILQGNSSRIKAASF